MKNNKPKHAKILKILGFTFLIIGISLTILGVTALKWEHSPNPAVFAPGMLLIGPSIFMIILGFSSNIVRMQAETLKHIQEESKDDLKDIADNTADIYSDAITKTAKAVKKGIKDTMFCKYCGAKIDTDSKFCNKCGKEQ